MRTTALVHCFSSTAYRVPIVSGEHYTAPVLLSRIEVAEQSIVTRKPSCDFITPGDLGRVWSSRCRVSERASERVCRFVDDCLSRSLRLPTLLRHPDTLASHLATRPRDARPQSGSRVHGDVMITCACKVDHARERDTGVFVESCGDVWVCDARTNTD